MRVHQGDLIFLLLHLNPEKQGYARNAKEQCILVADCPRDNDEKMPAGRK